MDIQDDPRRPIIEVMAKLGRETQLHMDERSRHFRVTDAVTISVSIILTILAVFNVYFVWVLSKDLDGMVNSMDSMFSNLQVVDKDMAVIADTIDRFTGHVSYMTNITENVIVSTNAMPGMRGTMDSMRDNMIIINDKMSATSAAMGNISNNMNTMTSGMGIMRQNVRQIANPMGMMNPILP